MPSTYGKNHRRKDYIFLISTKIIRKNMTLNMIYPNKRLIKCEWECLGNGHSCQKRRKESGFLCASNNIYLSKRHICLSENIINTWENSICMTTSCNLRHDSSSTLMFELSPSWERYTYTISHKCNGSIITRCLKCQNIHIKVARKIDWIRINWVYLITYTPMYSKNILFQIFLCIIIIVIVSYVFDISENLLEPYFSCVVPSNNSFCRNNYYFWFIITKASVYVSFLIAIFVKIFIYFRNRIKK